MRPKQKGNNFYNLILAGPVAHLHFKLESVTTADELNTRLNYLIAATRNFIGLERGKESTMANST